MIEMKIPMCISEHNAKTKQEPNFDPTLLYQRLQEHCGHDIAIVKYGIGKGCYALQCEDCNEVLFDTDIYDLCGIDEEE